MGGITATPFQSLQKRLNHRKSSLISSVIGIWFSTTTTLSASSRRETNLPTRDCNCFLVIDVPLMCLSTTCNVSVTLLVGIERVICVLSIVMLSRSTALEGGVVWGNWEAQLFQQSDDILVVLSSLLFFFRKNYEVIEVYSGIYSLRPQDLRNCPCHRLHMIARGPGTEGNSEDNNKN